MDTLNILNCNLKVENLGESNRGFFGFLHPIPRKYCFYFLDEKYSRGIKCYKLEIFGLLTTFTKKHPKTSFFKYFKMTFLDLFRIWTKRLFILGHFGIYLEQGISILNISCYLTYS